MVDMFQALPEGGSMAKVAGAIWKILLTTVAGLSVAIPAILLHTWLGNLVDNEEEKLNRAAEFMIRERML
jgi:biopolymer transport protein ExbB